MLVIDYLKNHGYRIPEDISIISVDGVPSAQMNSPALTTVYLPSVEIGQIAVEVLESRLIGHRKIPIKVEVPFQLFIRETVRKLP